MTTLTDVKQYMRARGRATLTDIAVGLSTTPDNARMLLEIWRGKNRVRCISGACGPCGKSHGCGCATEVPDIYEWITDEGGRSQ